MEKKKKKKPTQDNIFPVTTVIQRHSNILETSTTICLHGCFKNISLTFEKHILVKINVRLHNCVHNYLLLLFIIKTIMYTR